MFEIRGQILRYRICFPNIRNCHFLVGANANVFFFRWNLCIGWRGEKMKILECFPLTRKLLNENNTKLQEKIHFDACQTFETYLNNISNNSSEDTWWLYRTKHLTTSIKLDIRKLYKEMKHIKYLCISLHGHWTIQW